MLLPSFYFAPIEYYAFAIRTQRIELETHEHFNKQTYRNRCTIMSVNGPIHLSIPVLKSAPKMLMKDVQIAYKDDWNKVHWKGLVSAYQNSPFFEYYDYLFEPFFKGDHESLIELNTGIHRMITKCLSMDQEVSFTSTFSPIESQDFRTLFHAKRGSGLNWEWPNYQQVFSDRLGFHPNLSILDLIFNLGPSARLYLLNLTLPEVT